MHFFEKQRGSALIYVLICSLLFTGTLLVIINYFHLQQRLVNRKGHLLHAKYSAEGALYKFLEQIENNREEISLEMDNPTLSIFSGADSARVNACCWGGFIYVSAVAEEREEIFSLETTIGLYPSGIFNAALILNPRPTPLVLSGGSRIQGDVYIGSGGIQKNQPGIHEYESIETVTGKIIENSKDVRPQMDLIYLKKLWQYFEETTTAINLTTLAEISTEPSDYFTADSSAHLWKEPTQITNELFNSKNWQLRGPLSLISREPLCLKSDLILEHYVQLFSDHSIIIEGKNATYHEVLLYSPQKVIISETDNFCGQIFSEQSIVIKNNSHLHYPTLLTVWGNGDSNFIQIDASSSVTGSVILISQDNPAEPLQKQAKISIEEGAVVNGLVWSDNFVQLNGKVNGIVICDQLYEYQSPTVYLNWLRDGSICRQRLNYRFRLPFFIKESGLHFLPMELL